MQGICRLSRRWHQQFCHSPAFGPHQKCLQSFIPSRQIRQARRLPPQRSNRSRLVAPSVGDYLESDDTSLLSPTQLFSKDRDDLVVREFEQLGSDKSTQKRIDATDGVGDEAEEIWNELQDVERQLEIAQQGPFGPQSPFMMQLDPEDRERFKKVLEEEGYKPDDEEDALDLAEIDRMLEEDDAEANESEGLAVTLHIPRAHQSLVNHFNTALKEANENGDDVHKSLSLWKWYLRCQQKVPGFSRIISESVWDFLWKSQRAIEARPQHLVLLGRDMLAAGESLPLERKLQYLEALQACEQTAEAITTWEAMHEELNSNCSIDFLTRFYTTGIRLHAVVHRPQRAWNVATKALRKGVKPGILTEVVSAWAQSKTPDSATKAWVVYLKMRYLLEDKMDAQLYDEVSNSLLDTKHNSMAVSVFKDMIMHHRGLGKNTLRHYQRAVGQIPKDSDPADFEKAVNQVSLNVLLFLPKEFQNKFFFASWIKRLLGQERIEAAAEVVDLMYERKIKPDALHLNGIIGAWLRDGSPRSVERAERLAREMIQVRINQATTHTENMTLSQSGSLIRKTTAQHGQDTWKRPNNLSRPVPAANLETFSLLFNFYEEGRQWQNFQQLRETMTGPAQLKPNTFIVNRWLAAELHTRAYDRFWKLYKSLQGVLSPNVETFQLAWQMSATQMQAFKPKPQRLSSSWGDESSHKAIFASMMDWAQRLNARKTQAAKFDFVGSQFYFEIVRSFCHQLDLAAVVCALQGLYRTFGATPDDASVQLITGQVARILPRTAASSTGLGRRRRLAGHSTPEQNTLKSIAEIIETLEADKKQETAKQAGIDLSDLENPESATYKKIRLDVMTDFLVMSMHKTRAEGDVNTVKQRLAQVGESMHVDVDHVNDVHSPDLSHSPKE